MMIWLDTHTAAHSKLHQNETSGVAVKSFNTYTSNLRRLKTGYKIISEIFILFKLETRTQLLTQNYTKTTRVVLLSNHLMHYTSNLRRLKTGYKIISEVFLLFKLETRTQLLTQNYTKTTRVVLLSNHLIHYTSNLRRLKTGYSIISEIFLLFKLETSTYGT